MWYDDDKDIMELDDVVGIKCTTTDFMYDIDLAFDVYSQGVINTKGKGNYLLEY